MAKGLAYPLQIDPATSNLKTVQGAELVRSYILSVLETEPGESPLRPTYGTPGILFEAYGDFAGFAAGIKRQLTKELPEARFEVSADYSREGNVLLSVEWRLAGEVGELSLELS